MHNRFIVTQMVKTITNIPHADYADKADYFKTLMTLIALIFFRFRKTCDITKKFEKSFRIALVFFVLVRDQIFIPKTCEITKKFERSVSRRLRRFF